MRPANGISTALQRFDTTTTDVDRFVDAIEVETIKNNHNYLAAMALRNDVYCSPSRIDVAGYCPLEEYPREVCFSTLIPVRPPTRELVMSVYGRGDIEEEESIKIYPFAVPIGKPARINLSKYITLGTANSSHDATIQLYDENPIKSDCGFALWNVGFACENTTTTTNLYGPTAGSVTETTLTVAAAWVNVNGHLAEANGYADIMRSVVAYYVAGATTYMVLARPWSRTCNGLSFNIIQVLHGMIYSLTIREAVLTTFNTVLDDV
jgi:hypothetical protein